MVSGGSALEANIEAGLRRETRQTDSRVELDSRWSPTYENAREMGLTA